MPEVWDREVSELIDLPREQLGLLILRRFKAGAQIHPLNEALLDDAGS